MIFELGFIYCSRVSHISYVSPILIDPKKSEHVNPQYTDSLNSANFTFCNILYDCFDFIHLYKTMVYTAINIIYEVFFFIKTKFKTVCYVKYNTFLFSISILTILATHIFNKIT